MKKMKFIRILSIILTLAMMVNMVSIGAYAISTNETQSLGSAIDSNLLEVIEDANQMIASGAESIDVYELYYNAGYITREDIKQLLALETELSSQPLVKTTRTSTGDIWRVNQTFNKSFFVGISNVSGIVSAMASAIAYAAGPTFAGAAAACVALLTGVAASILSYMTSGSWSTVTITGAIIYQFNPDNLSNQWMPYEAFQAKFK